MESERLFKQVKIALCVDNFGENRVHPGDMSLVIESLEHVMGDLMVVNNSYFE